MRVCVSVECVEVANCSMATNLLPASQNSYSFDVSRMEMPYICLANSIKLIVVAEAPPQIFKKTFMKDRTVGRFMLWSNVLLWLHFFQFHHMCHPMLYQHLTVGKFTAKILSFDRLVNQSTYVCKSKIFELDKITEDQVRRY